MPTAESPALLSVPVIHAEPEGAHEIELVIGVGCRDDPPHIAGITHLAEHLLMVLAGPDATARNGSTLDRSVVFSSAASREEAEDSIRRICDAIAHVDRLTEEQVTRELAILEIEDPMRFEGLVPGPATIRFGYDGLGLVGAGTPALASVTRDEVVAWVRERFTGDRSVIIVSGPWAVAPSLELPSPPAERTHRVPAGRGATTPVAVPTELPGVALSVVVPAEVSLALDHAITFDGYERLRMEEGLTYTVDVHASPVDVDAVQLDIAVGAPPQHVRAATVAAVALLRSIAVDGFSPLAVARGRADAELLLEEPRRIIRARASDEADARLFRAPRPDVATRLRAGAAVEGEALRVAWAAALPSLIVMFSEEADTGDPEALAREIGMPIDDMAPSQALTAEEFASATRGLRTWRSGMAPFPARNRFAVDGTRLLILLDGRSWAIDLERVVVALVTDDFVVLVSEDARLFQIGVRSLRRASELVEAVVAAVRVIAPERVRRLPSR
ncbi:hypothetical protein ABID70_002623 [Clavibacter michiganensis]|uniref:insulinase family protein n=1 Tax=Clavibacter michiganensis TaxID=28447 RepID=UPI001AE3817B|nr:insulinase family protein [Clavibacter michiganensis]MBP2457097.1 hypothetical protein [Clavibacter michiganensis]MDQ0409667.1 hypothetical protein [Clavibacter michiganensis]